SRLLKDRLRVNHLLFWNRYPSLADRPAFLETDPLDPHRLAVALHDTTVDKQLLILQCWDRQTLVQYHEERWSSWVDPSRRFRTDRTGEREVWLRFASPVGNQLTFAFLLAAPWENEPDVRKDQTVVFAGPQRLAQLVVRSGILRAAEGPSDE